MHTRSKLAIACALALTLLSGCSSDDDGVDPGPSNVSNTVPGDVVPGTPPNDPGTDPGTDNPPSAPDGAPFTLTRALRAAVGTIRGEGVPAGGQSSGGY